MDREFKQLTQKEQNELLYYMVRNMEKDMEIVKKILEYNFISDKYFGEED